MANDVNTTVPSPGDPDHYDYVTKTGKYDPKKIALDKKLKAASGKVKQVVRKPGLIEQALAEAERKQNRFGNGGTTMLTGN